MAWNQDFGEGANPGTTHMQQSWRDSYNDGEAAGDWTGNTNARLEAERDAFQGATWSGSSTQYSALELARMLGAHPDVPKLATNGLLTGQSGQGAITRSTYAAQGRPGAAAAMMNGGAGAFGKMMANKPQDLVIGGFHMQANPFYSNAEDGEARGGEIMGELMGIMAIGSDLGHNAARMYFGENYRDLSPSQRLGILGNDAMGATARGADSALAAVFQGWDSVLKFREEQHAIGKARDDLEREIDEGWALRNRLEAEEAKYQEYRADIIARGGTP